MGFSTKLISQKSPAIPLLTKWGVPPHKGEVLYTSPAQRSMFLTYNYIMYSYKR